MWGGGWLSIFSIVKVQYCKAFLETSVWFILVTQNISFPSLRGKVTAFLIAYRLWHQPSRTTEEGTVLGEEKEEREGTVYGGNRS